MRLSLRLQLVLILLGVTGLSVVLVGLPILNLMERSLVEQRVVHGRLVTDLLAVSLEAALEGPALDDPERSAVALERVGERYLESGLVDQLELLDGAGGRLAVTPSEAPIDVVVTPAGDETDGLQARLVHDPGGGRLVVVTRGIEPLGGRLRATYSLGDAIERLETARFLASLYAVLDAALILILGYVLLTRVVVRPIRRIGLAAERVAAGDHASRLDITSRNEIGTVARSFNHMLDRLEEGRRELEAQVRALEAAKRDLERAQSAVIRGERMASVGRLAAGLAHEVGNPLSAVLGMAEILREDPKLPIDQRRELFARLERELLRIHETIRNLLDYSRSASEELSPTDVADVIQRARTLVEAQSKFRGLELSVSGVEKLPLVRANADRLLQVMVNLLMNAADAMNGSGRIDVEAEREAADGGGVVIRVRDTGPGIPDEVLAHVFEPFFTTKPPGQGTGLGLAISESIVESFGGGLEVDGGGRGQGACFTLRLERATPHADGETGVEGRA